MGNNPQTWWKTMWIKISQKSFPPSFPQSFPHIFFLFYNESVSFPQFQKIGFPPVDKVFHHYVENSHFPKIFNPEKIFLT